MSIRQLVNLIAINLIFVHFTLNLIAIDLYIANLIECLKVSCSKLIAININYSVRMVLKSDTLQENLLKNDTLLENLLKNDTLLENLLKNDTLLEKFAKKRHTVFRGYPCTGTYRGVVFVVSVQLDSNLKLFYVIHGSFGAINNSFMLTIEGYEQLI